MTNAAALAKIRMCIKRAAEEGRDPVEYLDAYGWLATPSRLDEVELELLDEIMDVFRRTSVAQLVGGAYATGNWSANDFAAGVIRVLQREKEKIQPNS